jgi:hypothetical protein
MSTRVWGIFLLSLAWFFQGALPLQGAGAPIPIGYSLEDGARLTGYLEVPTGRSGGHFIFLTHLGLWDRVDAFLKKYL